MTKGVSTIVATILLLLIVIAIVGFAFGFFQRFFGIATSTGEEQLQLTQQNIQTSMRIESASGTPVVGATPASSSIIVRNTGAADINTANVVLFLNDVIQLGAAGCTWRDVGDTIGKTTITPNELANCKLSSDCSAKSVKFTTPGLEAAGTCV